MNKVIIKKIIFLILIIVLNILSEANTKDTIAFSFNGNIWIIGFDGILIKEIKLPVKIGYAFKIKGTMLYYQGIDYNLYSYDYKTQEIKKINYKLPFLLKDKIIELNEKYQNGYYWNGPEVYEDIDFSKEKKKIVIIAKHAYYKWISYNGMEYKKINTTSYLYLVNIKDSKEYLISKSDDEIGPDRCYLFEDSVIHSGGAYGICVVNTESRKHQLFQNYVSKWVGFINVEKKNFFNSLDLIGFQNGKIYFTSDFIRSNVNELTNKKRKLKILYYYDIHKKVFKKIKIKIHLNLIRKFDICDILFETNNILLLLREKNGSKIFLFNSRKQSSKLIYKGDKKIKNLQFYKYEG